MGQHTGSTKVSSELGPALSPAQVTAWAAPAGHSPGGTSSLREAQTPKAESQNKLVLAARVPSITHVWCWEPSFAWESSDVPSRCWAAAGAGNAARGSGGLAAARAASEHLQRWDGHRGVGSSPGSLLDGPWLALLLLLWLWFKFLPRIPCQ